MARTSDRPPVLALNINTIPDDVLCAKYLPELDVACGNLKDPLKIEEKKAEARRKQLEQAALNPHVSRVLAVHFAMPTNDVHTTILAGCDDAAEIAVIGEAHGFIEAHLAGHPDCRLVTFNGASFDIPFLLRRCAILRLMPPVTIECNKYRVIDGKANHIDIRRVLAETLPGSGPSDYAPGDLDYYARLFLGEGKPPETDGRIVGQYWKAGRVAEAMQYGELEARLTLDLYERLRGFYFL